MRFVEILIFRLRRIAAYRTGLMPKLKVGYISHLFL
jgi:hypothetical protein